MEEHPIALIAHGELAKRAADGGGPAYLHLRELRDRTGLDDDRIMEEITEAVRAGRITVSAVEVLP